MPINEKKGAGNAQQIVINTDNILILAEEQEDIDKNTQSITEIKEEQVTQNFDILDNKNKIAVLEAIPNQQNSLFNKQNPAIPINGGIAYFVNLPSETGDIYDVAETVNGSEITFKVNPISYRYNLSSTISANESPEEISVISGYRVTNGTTTVFYEFPTSVNEVINNEFHISSAETGLFKVIQDDFGVDWWENCNIKVFFNCDIPATILANTVVSDLTISAATQAADVEVNFASGQPLSTVNIIGDNPTTIPSNTLVDETYLSKITLQTQTIAGAIVANNGITSAKLNANGAKILGVADPTSENDAANKKYVDTRINQPIFITASDLSFDTSNLQMGVYYVSLSGNVSLSSINFGINWGSYYNAFYSPNKSVGMLLHNYSVNQITERTNYVFMLTVHPSKCILSSLTLSPNSEQYPVNNSTSMGTGGIFTSRVVNWSTNGPASEDNFIKLTPAVVF